MDPTPRQLAKRIDGAMLVDRARLRAGLEQVLRARRPADGARRRLIQDIERSVVRRVRRQANLPKPTYPPELPVVQRRAEIARAIADHQVVVVCGETGSGKTTQLPKICLELGRGVAGMIGHTQPRRIAARSVAARLAEELGTPLNRDDRVRGTRGRGVPGAGAAAGIPGGVGYKVRFTDETSPDTYIKIMTDGILLAETQGDRLLEQYDTLIIDEAHERSLNIDFLLGYLHQLLPRRPELRLIITSATIDPQRFSKHFHGAPIIEVSGRVYPVDVLYQPAAPLDIPGAGEGGDALDIPEAVLRAVEELTDLDRHADVLIFMSGEREIRETAEVLRKADLRNTEVLPLYARLSPAEQMRVFQPHTRRRLVLATNVAETSLTVPGVRFVIDPGFARISRYSPRTKVERLPIEPVSQASADQRKGRCGRTSGGICIRLYSEEDFRGREARTPPEIQRTNLAGVILRMKSLRLGEVEKFPFLDPPDGRMIRDGYQTLHELGAIDGEGNLTPIGSALARLPIDPRVGRMILAARDEGVLPEVLVIAAALSTQDPRHRPMDNPQAADQAHAGFRVEGSDFLGFLAIWEQYHQQLRSRSRGAAKRWCVDHFLSYTRVREWLDIHQQLHSQVEEMGDRDLPPLPSGEGGGEGRAAPAEARGKGHSGKKPSPYPLPEGEGVGGPPPSGDRPQPQRDAIHRALLTGLLSNIGMRGEGSEYKGARGLAFHIFPGSGLFKSRPRWVMAAELVETTRLYARTVAVIQPAWVEALAAHLIQRTYSDPRWEREGAHVVADEKVTLWGLVLTPRRTVHYGSVDGRVAREIFLQRALVEEDYDTAAPFLTHNRAMVEKVEELEAKARRHDLLVDVQARFAFYDQRVPATINNGPAFEKWRRQAERGNAALLHMTLEDLLRQKEVPGARQFPDRLNVAGLELPLRYHAEPGHAADGVTMQVPLAALNQVDPQPCDWLVPGLLREKVEALIRSLPKPVRVGLGPMGAAADACMRELTFGEGDLLDSLARCLTRIGGQLIDRGMFHPEQLPDHLRMNFHVVDESGKTMGMGRDLHQLRAELGAVASASFSAPGEAGRHRPGVADHAANPAFHRNGITTWDFGDLPESVQVRRGGVQVTGYPALVDQGASVALRLMDAPDLAAYHMRSGLRRLLMLQLSGELDYLKKQLTENPPHPRNLQESPNQPQSQKHRRVGGLGVLPGGIGVPPVSARISTHETQEVLTWESLLDDVLAAGVDRLFLEGKPPIRTAMEFDLALREGWDRLAPTATALADLVGHIWLARQALWAQLDPIQHAAFAPTLADVRRQVAQLLAPGFITATPAPWLAQFQRFLEGARLRLEKLSGGGLARDQQHMIDFAPYAQRYAERLARHRAANTLDPALDHYRWMLEEMRVSLFAQELKTSIPVSWKRLDKQWEAIKA